MKAKTVEINAAHGFTKDEISNVFIKIRRRRNPDTMSEARKMHNGDAKRLYRTLYDSLPAATWEALKELVLEAE